MHTNAQKFAGWPILGIALAALMGPLARGASATTFVLGTDPVRNYTYGSTTVPAAPYNAHLVGAGVSDATLFFCIDESLTAIWGHSYTGTIRSATSAADQEAAWLAAYALSHGAPSNDTTIKNTIEGPISMAIWQIMGNMAIPNDPAAQPFIALAQNAYNTGQITPWFLNQVQIFVPDDHSIQQFMTAVPSTPEPGSIVFIAGGLLAFGLRRRSLASRRAP